MTNKKELRNIQTITSQEQIHSLLLKSKEKTLYNELTFIPIILTEIFFLFYSFYFFLSISLANYLNVVIILFSCFLGFHILFVILYIYYRKKTNESKILLMKYLLFFYKTSFYILFIILYSYFQTYSKNENELKYEEGYVFSSKLNEGYVYSSKLYDIGYCFQLIGYLIYICPNIYIVSINTMIIVITIIVNNIIIYERRRFFYLNYPDLFFICFSTLIIYIIKVKLSHIITKYVQLDANIQFYHNYYNPILETIASTTKFLSYEQKTNRIYYESNLLNNKINKEVNNNQEYSKLGHDDGLNSSYRTIKSKLNKGPNCFEDILLAYFKNVNDNKSYLIDNIKNKILTEKLSFELLGVYYDDTKIINDDTKEYQYQVFIRKVVIDKTCYIELLFDDMTKDLKLQDIKLKIKNKNESFAKVAHEFKTPLICNSALVDNLKEFLSKGKFSEAFKISEDIQKLSEYTFYLIDDIMQVTSILNRKTSVTICKEEKNPEEDLLFVFDILNVLIKMKNSNNNVESNLIISKEVMQSKISIDSIRLRQIIINFISNAVKFTKSGHINIVSCVVNPYLEIRVEDTGTGMKQDILNCLFKDERVVDLEVNMKTNRHGTGEGLNVVKNLCDLLNIKLSCSSKVGEGTVFKLQIPLVNEIIQSTGEEDESNSEKDSVGDEEIDNNGSINNLEVISERDDNKSKSDSSDSIEYEVKKLNRKTSTIKRIVPAFDTSLNIHTQNTQFTSTTFNKTFVLPLLKVEATQNKRSTEILIKSDKLEKLDSSTFKDPSRLSISYLNNTKNKVSTGGAKKSSSNLFLFTSGNINKRTSSINNGSIRGSFGSVFSNYFITSSQKTIPKQRGSRLYSIRKSTNMLDLFGGDRVSQYDLVPIENMGNNETNNSLGRPLIIICDDSEIIRNAIKKNFYSIDGLEKLFGIICCFDGAHALLKIIEDQGKGNLIKALFIDENMEYLGGTQTVKIIKRLIEDQKIKHISCVSISANDEVQENVYDLILPKPISKVALQEGLKKLKLT